jgi:hypothetical protein
VSSAPKTEGGKQRSRQNAVRHGLTAEIVVIALEDIEDYHAFDAAIIADYARTAVERELVLRLVVASRAFEPAVAQDLGLDLKEIGLNRRSTTDAP